jgi:glycosyltransferase involved in cell wall biosynthesis
MELNYQPLVSVLMTAYNREKYIAEAIESVMASTYQNWELIIVDDGSKDRTVEIAKLYELKDKRIKVYINETNLGDYPNRNKAASYAKGKYIKYVDADDLIYPHGLQVMVKYMEQFIEAAYALSKTDNDTTPLPILLLPTEAYKTHFFKKSVFTNSPLGAIIKKEIFDELGGFSGKRYIGDQEMWMKLSAKYPVVFIPSGLGFWRSHGNQEVVKGTTSYEYESLEKQVLFECIENYSPLTDNDNKSILLDYKKKQARKIIKKILKLELNQALKIKNKSGFKFMDFICAFK